MSKSVINIHQADWKIIPERDPSKKQVYSADEMINAYYRGRKDQKDKETQVLIEKLENNLKLAQSLSEKLYAYIKKKGFECTVLKLKIKDFSTFISLFIINENDFCDDKFLDVYKESIKIKKKHSGTTFDFRTIFSPDSSELSEECLSIDGFYLKYEV